jgi:hypothetical protein
MVGTKQNGILKVDNTLRSLYITNRISTDTGNMSLWSLKSFQVGKLEQFNHKNQINGPVDR